MKLGTLALILIALLVLAACGPGGAPDASETAEGDMGDMGDMGMVAHMRMMQSMSGDSIRGVLSTHRQMVANMIASMNGEMRDMDMPADEAWNATVDSLRADLVAMPEMDAAQLEALMPAHHRRATRLMEMHDEMMSGMGM